ncbi:FAD-dependent oxidoreductase [Synechococcus sp. RSCCF101]|uniref:NAD(P)/FAD-dependent oxidoreductase n=1 Tax=Synechococcus sp. RSCCF101 TaxID=2511069 RepID=UPI001246FC4A|nr:FAD-dependent oxidoreductase [Synechococcus sp. RSCCF101]QEY32784.1 FAD-dependent oxidoreductase [Synechococcus sp. RSCCF101]
MTSPTAPEPVRAGAEADRVQVLGGGLMGLAVAHALARRAIPVTVLSRRRSEAAGFVAAGMLAPHAEGLSGALLALGQRSLALVPEWVATVEADSGLPCGLRPCGIVVPFRDAAARDAYPTAAWGTPLDRRGLEQEVPGIGAAWQAALLFGQDGQIDNRRQLMRALERACVERAVRFEEGTEVVELLRETGSGALSGLRLQRANGQTLTMASRRAVLCGGAWSARLLPELPVFPVKGQMLSLQAPRQALSRVIFGPGTYLVPREDGLLVVGATSEAGAGFADGLTPAGQRQLELGLTALLPEAARWPPMERWWGFRPCTPDEGPLLGESPVPGLSLACGHHRNGVLLAAVTARLLADRLSGNGLAKPSDPDLDAFSWRRFSSERIDPQAPSAGA